MEVLYPRCAGLDVHAGHVTACVRIATGSEVVHHHRTVATTTRGLLALADWLATHACTHVAMEATGVVLETGVARLGGSVQPRAGQSDAHSPGARTEE